MSHGRAEVVKAASEGGAAGSIVECREGPVYVLPQRPMVGADQVQQQRYSARCTPGRPAQRTGAADRLTLQHRLVKVRPQPHTGSQGGIG